MANKEDALEAKKKFMKQVPRDYFKAIDIQPSADKGYQIKVLVHTSDESRKIQALDLSFLKNVRVFFESCELTPHEKVRSGPVQGAFGC